MKAKNLLTVLLTFATLIGLASCGNKDNNETSVESPIDNLPTEYDHYYSDRVSFAN